MARSSLRTIQDAFNLYGLTFSPSDQELITAHIHDPRQPIDIPNIREGWAVNNCLGRLALESNPRNEYWQMALDLRCKAVGDPCAVAFSPRGEWLVVAAAGTHELLLIPAAALEWNPGVSRDLQPPHPNLLPEYRGEGESKCVALVVQSSIGVL
jgi:hypothetical protein